MPLYSDSSSYYYGGGGNYTSLYSPYYSPGLYSSSSLSGGTTSSPYAPYSSIYSRQNTSSYGITPSVVSSTRSNFSSSRYKPKLTTINESPLSSRGLMPLTRIQSPKFTSSYSLPLKYIPPRPIPINTADIDVSSSRYRKHQVDRKIEETIRDKRNIADIREESDCNNNKDNNLDKNENNECSNVTASETSPDNSCFMPRIDGGVRGRPNRSTIRRDRAVVRLSTVRKDRSKMDSSRYTDSEVRNDQLKAPKRPIAQIETQPADDNTESAEKTSWREKFGDDLSLKAFAIAKKTPGELLRERYFIPDKDEDDCSPVRKLLIPTPPDASNEEMLLEVDPFMHSAIRRLSLPKCPSFHEICEDISSDKIDDDLNAGELRRRASIIHDQEIEMINKLQKSTSGSFQQINLERNVSTEDLRKSFNRKSTKKSKKIRHKITAIVGIENPVLVPIIQETIEDELKSPVPVPVPPKITFKVDAIEEHTIVKLPKKKAKTSPKIKKSKSTDDASEFKPKVRTSPKKKPDQLIEIDTEPKISSVLPSINKDTEKEQDKNYKTTEEVVNVKVSPKMKKLDTFTSPKVSPKTEKVESVTSPKVSPKLKKLDTFTSPKVSPKIKKVESVTSPKESPKIKKVESLTSPKESPKMEKLDTFTSPKESPKIKKVESLTSPKESPKIKKVESVTSPKESPKTSNTSKIKEINSIAVEKLPEITPAKIVSPVGLKLANKSTKAEIFTFDTSAAKIENIETTTEIHSINSSPKVSKSTVIEKPISPKPTTPNLPKTSLTSPKPLTPTTPIVATKLAPIPKPQTPTTKDFPVSTFASKTPFGTTTPSPLKPLNNVTSKSSSHVFEEPKSTGKIQKSDSGEDFWSQIGSRETIFMNKRKQTLLEEQWRKRESFLEDQSAEKVKNLDEIKTKITLQKLEVIKTSEQTEGALGRSQSTDSTLFGVNVNKKKSPKASKLIDEKILKPIQNLKSSATPPGNNINATKIAENDKLLATVNTGQTAKSPEIQNNKDIAIKNKNVIVLSKTAESLPQPTTNVTTLAIKSTANRAEEPKIHVASVNLLKEESKLAIDIATPPTIKSKTVDSIISISPKIQNEKTGDASVVKQQIPTTMPMPTPMPMTITTTPTTKDAAKISAIVTKSKEKQTNSEAVIKANTSGSALSNEEVGRNVNNLLVEVVNKKSLGSSPKTAAKTTDTELEQPNSTGSPKSKKTNAKSINNNGGENTIGAKVNFGNQINDSTVVTVAPVATKLISQKTNANLDNEILNASVQTVQSSVSQLPPLSQKEAFKVNTTATATTTTATAKTATNAITATPTATTASAAVNINSSQPDSSTSNSNSASTTPLPKFATVSNLARCLLDVDADLEDFLQSSEGDSDCSYEYSSGSGAENLTDSMKKRNRHRKKKEKNDEPKFDPNKVVKIDPKKKCYVKEEAPRYPLVATPRPLWKREKFTYPEESDSDDSEETESESECSTSDEYEDEINPSKDTIIRMSTCSNDSGFEGGTAPPSPKKMLDCEVNCHKKCEKLTANLCGVNQKLIVEALTSVRRGVQEARDSPSTPPSLNPAYKIESNHDCDDETSYTYAQFQKNGRITAPATTIPRFKEYHVEDFHFLAVLGKGSFGKVLLAELTNTDYYYAVKCLKKDVVLEDDDIECTFIERKVLALGTKHPYLCHLFCTFQTESHLFFVMEYLNGGDLMFHIQESGRFPESRARFYGAEIISGLKFLHRKGIIYRDLKLDNVLLDYEGHVRIADFGMCKLQIYLDKTADSFCGTPDYMAPEIIKDIEAEKYNQNVDWWSFGVLLYEMLIGQSPFSGCDEDELFWSICNEIPWFPVYISEEATSLLKGLLEKDSSKRIGSQYSPAGDVMDHRFFREIDWKLLEARQLEPPFKPQVKHPLDTQYFDKTFTRERVRLTPIDREILQSMDQKNFEGFSYTNPNATLD